MEKIINFINVLSWFGAVILTLISICQIFWSITGLTLKEKLDDMRQGVKTTFSVWRFLIPCLLCWIWIIAN